MIVMVCQYCGSRYGMKDGKGESGESHGICRDPECMEKWRRQMEEWENLL